MDNRTLEAVVAEIAPILTGRVLGKIFQTAAHQLTIDFRPGDGRYLYLNLEPGQTPGLYLARRRVRDLEKASAAPGQFVLFARKRLANAELRDIAKQPDDRLVWFEFLTPVENQGVEQFTLVAQLTGRSANLFLLDAGGVIIESLREAAGDGQEVGQSYDAPQPTIESNVSEAGKSDKSRLLKDVQALLDQTKTDFPFDPPSPLSFALDRYFRTIEIERDFAVKARAATGKARAELKRKTRLRQSLENDLTKHGDAETNKKIGDLLLANLSTATRDGNQTTIVDYFAEDAPRLTIEIDENQTLTEAAEAFFTRYAKARRAVTELTGRIETADSEIADLNRQIQTLEAIAKQRDAAALAEFLGENIQSEETKGKKSNRNFERKPSNQQQGKKKSAETVSGARRYRSSDGYEILVGRASKDNDYLTFRVAKSLDWWLHAADYPGSHVIVRNPSRSDLPTKTLLEAAELAAKFSQAREDSKVAVNYTQRKFVTKPKLAAPGLVRLAGFRTILVQPKESGERILD